MPDLEDVAALAVFADGLEERGDPRAHLIRAQLRGDAPAVERLLAAHGQAWLGSIVPGDTLIAWKPGHVTELALRRPAPEGLLGQLAELPTLRRVRRLGLSSVGHLAALGALEELKDLAVFSRREDSWGSLGRVTLPALERLTLDVQSPVHLDALSTLHAPKLRFLDTRVAPSLEAEFVRIVGVASWGQTLDQWRHRPQSAPGLASLGGCWPLLARAGRGLTVLCTAPLLDQVTHGLHRVLPAAAFVQRPMPETPRDPEETHSEATVTMAPVRAPTHFRSLPPRGVRQEFNPQHDAAPAISSVGSGIPLKEVLGRDRFFSRCGWCGSEAMSCIADSHWSMYSHFETTWFYQWEGECQDCRLFTQSGAMTIS